MPERKPDSDSPPEERLRAAFDAAESNTAKAFEQAVNTPSFGAILARGAENAAALSRISTEFADLVLRNLRLAGRSDITRLARQIHRTEDKLERVLQEIELLRDEIAARDAAQGSGAGPARAAGAARTSRAAGRASTSSNGGSARTGGNSKRTPSSRRAQNQR